MELLTAGGRNQHGGTSLARSNTLPATTHNTTTTTGSATSVKGILKQPEPVRGILKKAGSLEVTDTSRVTLSECTPSASVDQLVSKSRGELEEQSSSNSSSRTHRQSALSKQASFDSSDVSDAVSTEMLQDSSSLETRDAGEGRTVRIKNKAVARRLMLHDRRNTDSRLFYS